MKNFQKDQIYAYKLRNIDDFVFDDKVANVFEDMITRSVPGYDTLNKLIPIIANKYLKPNTNCYDLGCSLANVSLCIAKNIKHEGVNIYAVDNSPSMIQKAEKKITSLDCVNTIHAECSDIFDVEIRNASFVILNYTLQFIDSGRRKELISNIFSGVNTGGALFLSEKITHQDKEEDNIMRELHENYKRTNAYSEIEISQKREALENVLIRDTHNLHLSRLKNAGFSNIYMLFKYLNFVSYLAVK